MLNNARPKWLDDGLNRTLVAVVIVAAVALYFIVVRGWSWSAVVPS
jgi:hypothetical protein